MLPARGQRQSAARPWVWGRARGESAGGWRRELRTAGLVMLMVGTSAMMPQAASSPLRGGTARGGACARGPEGLFSLQLDCAGQRLCEHERRAAGAPGLGPAAAAAGDSALRLRGGDAGSPGSPAVAERAAPPNGVKSMSYKQVASAGLEAEPAEGDAPRNGDEGESKLVLQVDELKIEALRKLGQSLRLGGPGTARRKFKAVRKAGKMDEVKFQNALRKTGFNPVGEVDSVEVYQEDGTVWTFNNPRLLANQQASQFCIQGRFEERKPTEAEIRAREFNALSDIEKLRQLAQAELPATGGGAAASAAESAPAGADEAAAEPEGEESGDEEKGSPEDLLAAKEEEEVAAGGNADAEVDAEESRHGDSVEPAQ